MQYTEMLKLYLVCLSYLLIRTDVVRCEPDYLFNEEAKGWLKLHKFPTTWEEALLTCHYEGAVLASPLNNQLARALFSLFQEQTEPISPIFLGIHDLFSKGDFISLEGVPPSAFTIELLPYGTDIEDCLVMASTGSDSYKMTTSSCKHPLPFICYRKLDNQTMNECGTFDSEYHLNQRTGSCYKVHRKEHTWTRAYKICAAEGGHLVILNDEEEARVVQDMFSGGTFTNYPQNIVISEGLHVGFHVGAVAWGDDQIWKTIHGDNIEDVYNVWDYSTFDRGMIRESKLYANLLDTGFLREVNADVRAMFVCEKSPNSIRYDNPSVTMKDGSQ